MKDSARKELYLIIEINLKSKALAMHMALRVIAKLGGVIYWAKSLERPKNIRKNRATLRKLGLMMLFDGI